MAARNGLRKKFVKRSWEKLKRRLRRYVPGEAEDVATDALIELRVRLGRWPHPEHDAPLLNLVAMESGIDNWRLLQNRNRVELDFESLVSGDLNPEQVIVLLETLDFTSRALRKVEPRRARVFYLVHVVGYTMAETAVLLGLTEDKARNRLRSGMRRMRHLLNRAG